MNKMAAPTGQHGKYLFWLQLLNRLSDFHTVFTDDLRKRSSLFPDQGDWCHCSPLTFCDQFELEPLPASAGTICLYLAYMAETFVYSSIQNYLSAVWVLHHVHSIPHIDIHDHGIKFTLQGIRRVLGDATNSATPMTVQDLKKIYTMLDMSCSEDLAFWLSLILGFRALLRKSNLFESGLALVHNDGGVLLSLRRTKTICFRECVLEIPLVSLPNSIFCVKFYSIFLRSILIHPSPQSHFLSYHSGSGIIPCTYQWFSKRLSSACVSLGLNKYTSHSLRKGGATTLANAEVALHDIKSIGDWKSWSVLLYLDRPIGSKIELDRKCASKIFR